MEKLRVYADTSVFGGCFDEEYADESRDFFDGVRSGKFILVISPTTLREMAGAPSEVQMALADLPPEVIEVVPDSDEVDNLRDAYLSAGVVGRASWRDAEHIAAATVAHVDMVVSWNFRHMVHYEKIAGYQGVNLLRGYRAIQIFSPKEVI